MPRVSKLDPKNPKMCFGGGGRFRFQKGLLKTQKKVETKGITWELGNENETKRAREETKGVSKMVLEDLEMIIQLQHTGLLSVLEESLKEVPLDEEDGFLLGSVIKKLQGERGSLESSLDKIRGIHRCQLKHLEVPELEKPPIEIGLSGTEEITQEEVLQTVTVCEKRH